MRQTKLQVAARNLRLKSDCVGVGSSQETNDDFPIDHMSASDHCPPNFNPWYGIAPLLATPRMPTCGWPRTPMLDFGNVEQQMPNSLNVMFYQCFIPIKFLLSYTANIEVCWLREALETLV